MLFPHMLNLVPPIWVHLLESNYPELNLKEELVVENALSHRTFWNVESMKVHPDVVEFSIERYGPQMVLVLRSLAGQEPTGILPYTCLLGVEDHLYWYWIQLELNPDGPEVAAGRLN